MKWYLAEIKGWNARIRYVEVIKETNEFVTVIEKHYKNGRKARKRYECDGNLAVYCKTKEEAKEELRTAIVSRIDELGRQIDELEQSLCKAVAL